MLDRQDPIGVSTFPLGRCSRCLPSGVLVLFPVGERVIVAPDAPAHAPLAAHLDDPHCGRLVGVECMLPASPKLDRPDMAR